MQLFTTLILVTLPIIFVQFLLARLPVNTSEDKVYSSTIEALYEEVVLPESTQLKPQPDEEVTDKVELAFQGDELFLLYDEIEDNVTGVEHSKFVADDLSFENTVTEPVIHKKVRLVKGKQHVQGMEFLSVILMLKEKQK